MLREGEDKAPAEAPAERPAENASILCRRCGAHLTDGSQALQIEGKHHHQLVNPAGVSFHVRTFGEVECATLGEAEGFFSWFAGHTWRIALCNACHTHIGWRFEGKSVFHGLIAERIAEAA